LPDSRPVDRFKLQVVTREREKKARAAREAERFQAKRDAVYMGNQYHAKAERDRATVRRFFKG